MITARPASPGSRPLAALPPPITSGHGDHGAHDASRRARLVTVATAVTGRLSPTAAKGHAGLQGDRATARRDRHHIPHPIQGLEVGKPPSPTKAYIAVASARGGCAQCHHETRYYHPTTYQPRHTVQVARCVLGDAGVSKASARSPQRRKRGPASGSNRAVLKRGAYCARVTSRALVSRALGARPRQMGSSCRPLPSLASSPLTT